jgi:3-dehydroquinate dehydratase-2
MTTVNVINGPNLGRLGRREAQVYGSTTHDDLVAMIEREATELGLKAVVRQTDSEAELLTGSIAPSTPANRWCSMRVR